MFNPENPSLHGERLEGERKLNNETKDNYERLMTKIISELASKLHDQWRERRRKSDGTFEPRLKETKDQEWIKSHNNQREVDIVNTSFDELPADWQEENIFSAKIALSKIEDALYLLHDKWLDRNFESATPEQKIQYSRLPKEEKEKDIQILHEAIETIGQMNNQE